MTALQARVVGVSSDETPVKQAPKAASAQVVPATRRNRRRPGLYKPTGMQFPLFHAWRP